MKKFEYKGKVINREVWVYGEHFTVPSQQKKIQFENEVIDEIGHTIHCIIDSGGDIYKVIPESVNICIERTDMCGDKIYAGDIVKRLYNNSIKPRKSQVGVVQYPHRIKWIWVVEDPFDDPVKVLDETVNRELYYSPLSLDKATWVEDSNVWFDRTRIIGASYDYSYLLEEVL